jgi:cation transport ATPase
MTWNVWWRFGPWERRQAAIAATLEALDADVVGQRLRIKYDAARLTTARIAEAVAQTGMRAWLEHDQPVGAAPSAATRRLLVIVSGVLLGIGMALELTAIDRRVIVGAYAIAIASGGLYSVRRALHAARSLALDINVLMLVAVAGAASFLTPIATPANMMVMGAGGYRFSDYWKLGLVTTLAWFVVAVLLIPVIWPT